MHALHEEADGLTLDDVELTVRGRLHDVLAHLGSEDGDPSLSDIDIACFVTTSANEGAVRAAWTRAVARCPVRATLRKAATITLKLSLLSEDCHVHRHPRRQLAPFATAPACDA